MSEPGARGAEATGSGAPGPETTGMVMTGPGDEVGSRMGVEVWQGLSRPQKTLPSKYFYDTRGSELFERITELPEYYLTRVERTLLERWVPAWIGRIEPTTLVELGAGSAAKTRILLEAMKDAAGGDGWDSLHFVPLDVSEDFLRDTAEALRSEYPGLIVTPEVVDLSRRLQLSEPLERPALFAFLGSTIGNFDPPAATGVLGHVRRLMGGEDRLVLGADLRPGSGKSREELEAAYNDRQGVTAEFNRNVLRVLNRELGADFEVGDYRHRAFYDAEAGRIEMHLVAERPQTVGIPGRGTVRFDAGESVRTEISCKYDRTTVDALFRGAGLEVEDWREDEAGRYALVLARPTAHEPPG